MTELAGHASPLMTAVGRMSSHEPVALLYVACGCQWLRVQPIVRELRITQRPPAYSHGAHRASVGERWQHPPWRGVALVVTAAGGDGDGGGGGVAGGGEGDGGGGGDKVT